jgi:hypothetical protein
VTANAYGLRLLRQPRVRLAAVILLVALVLIFRALQFALFSTQIQWGYDFSAYWAAANHVLAGEPIYSAAQIAGPYAPQQHYLYLYPPPVAAAVTPFGVVFPSDYRPAAWIWAAMGATILVSSVLTLTRAEQLGERYPVLQRRGAWLLVAAAFAFPPVIGELVLGNVHLLLLGLLTAAWLGVRRGDSTGELAAGIAVGVAAVVKVFPGALLIWFVLTRRWRAVAGVFIGAAGFVAVTLPFTGLESWRQFPTVLANLSAPSDTTDTLAPTVWLAPYLGFLGARIVVTVAAVALLAAVSIRARTDLRSVSSATTARTFAAAVVIAVLISPAVYQHYLALLVLPLLLGLGAGVPLRYLVIAYFCMWGGKQEALGDAAWIVNRGLPTIGTLVLLAGLVVPARKVTGTLGLDADARPDATVADDRAAGLQRGAAHRPGAG